MIDVNEPGGFRLTGRHVLTAMLAFFGCVIAVNIVFVVLALGTWTGLTDHDSYRTGLSWNRTLEADAAQKALGWSAEITAGRPDGSTDGALRRTVSLFLQDRDARPIPDLTVFGEARHPVVEAMDTRFPLEAAGPGRYVGTVDLPAASDWKLRLHALRPDGSEYRIDTVIVVR